MNQCLSKLIKLPGDCDDPLKYDFRNFLDFAYREVLLFDPPADICYDVADCMQNLSISEDGKARGQIQCQRGLGKSVIVAIFIAWLFYCNPDIKVAVICSTDDFAQRMVKFVRSLFDAHPLLQGLVPRIASENRLDDFKKDQLDNEKAFVCGARTRRDPDPSCKAFGIMATFTGIHPDVIVGDDVETPENSLTVLKRERIHEKCKEFESLIMPGGMILFMGTPQSIESLYIKYLDERYALTRWPARYPDPRDGSACNAVSSMLLRKLAEGEARPGDPTYVERFDEQELLVKEAIEGPIMFALQFMLDPTLADQDRYPLKLSDWIVMDVAMDMAPTRVMYGTTNPIGRMIDHAGLSTDKLYAPVYVDSSDYVEFKKSVMFVDPSGTGQDEVSYCVAKATQGMIFVAAAGGFKGDAKSDGVLRKLARIAWENDVREVVVEPNYGSGMYTKLLAPEVLKIHQCAVRDAAWSKGQKERRIIDVLGPLTRTHRLVVDPRVAKDEKLTYQYTHITYDRGCLQHDDRVEALAGACAEMADLVQVDPEQQDARRKQAQVEETARDFARSWERQAQMGRAISTGATVPYDVAREIMQSMPRRPRSRGTRGWTRT
jgi:hypothetical protein